MNIKKFLENLLELLLPRSETLRRLEGMTAGEFREAARHRAASLPEHSPDTLVLFDYKNPLVRRAVWELKYRGNVKIAELLATCVYEELAEELAERKSLTHFDTPLLIPIPLSKKRERERGFNQCELLADALQKCDGGNFFEVRKDILVKIRDTESQTKKNRAERLLNLKDCFAIHQPESVAGENVILLDDVLTTGATLEEARRTFRASGARRILAVAVAH